MKHCVALMVAGLLMVGGWSLQAEDHKKAGTKQAATREMGKPDVTYGQIKELTPGQKVVIHVENAIDKNFDLNDKDLAVKMASGLKVGDTVKVTEHSEAGITKRVEIAKHSGAMGTRGRATENK